MGRDLRECSHIVSIKREEGLDGVAHLSMTKAGESASTVEREEDKADGNKWVMKGLSYTKQRQMIVSRWSQRWDVQTTEWDEVCGVKKTNQGPKHHSTLINYIFYITENTIN